MPCSQDTSTGVMPSCLCICRGLSIANFVLGVYVGLCASAPCLKIGNTTLSQMWSIIEKLKVRKTEKAWVLSIIWQIVYKCSKIRGIVTLSRSWHPAEFTLGAQHPVFEETNRKTQSHVKCTKPAEISLLSKTFVLCACVHCENCPKRRYHDGNHWSQNNIQTNIGPSHFWNNILWKNVWKRLFTLPIQLVLVTQVTF